MEKTEANDKTFVDPLICEAVQIAVELERLNENFKNELKKIATLEQNKLADEMIIATIESYSKILEVKMAKFDSYFALIAKTIVTLGDHLRPKLTCPIDFASIVGRKVKLPRKTRKSLKRLSSKCVLGSKGGLVKFLLKHKGLSYERT